MAQTNFTPILTYKSDTASSVPSAGNLTNSANGAELAVNTADKRLFTKDSGGNVVEVGTNPSSLTLPNSTANGVLYLNGSKVATSGSALTFDGTQFAVKAATTESTNVNIGGGRSGSGYAYLDLVGDSAQASSYSARFIRGNGGANTTTSLIHKGTGAFEFTSSDAGYFTYNINGSEAMRLTSTGLGIGTSSPAFKLDVGGDNGTNIALRSTGTASAVFRAYVNSAEAGTIGFLNGGGQYFEVAGSEAMRLTSTSLYTASGINVGIGTSSPSSKLHLYSASGTAEIIQDSATALRFIVNSGTNYIQSGAALSSDSKAPLVFTSMYGVTEWMRLDTSGNLGLGVTPSAWNSGFKALQVNGAALFADASTISAFTTNAFYNSSGQYIYRANDYATSYRQYIGTHAWFTAASGTAGNAITFTQAMTLDASGRLLIGGTSTYDFNGQANLVVNGTANNATITIASTDTGYLAFADGTGGTDRYTGSIQYLHSSNAMLFSTNGGVERARIDSSGNLLVGKTSANWGTDGFEVSQAGIPASTNSATTNGTTTYIAYSSGASAYRFYVGYGGTVYATNTTISAISDIRYKENIRDLDAGLDKIMALKPRLYDWKEGKGANIKNARGFIAQEFEQVFPDLIDEWKDPAPEGEEPYKSVRQDLIPVLVKAIQEQQALIQQLTARVAQLESN